jgi:histidine decarboxylase
MFTYARQVNRLRFKAGIFEYLKNTGLKIDPDIVLSCEHELSVFNETVDNRFKNYLGYPNGIFPGFLPREIVDRLLLNIGDWRGNKYLGPNTHGYEFEATKYLKEIFQFPEGMKEWGNSCTGSSEAILAAVIYARTIFSGNRWLKPVVITSEEAHYSHKKCAFIAGLPCVTVKTNGKAGIDMKDFAECLSKLPNTPVIVLATCGTTVREGYDPIKEMGEYLTGHDAAFYLHVDAALCGFTAPFLDEVEDGLKPIFHKGVSSVSVSLHKAGACNRPSALLLGIDYASGSVSPITDHVSYIDAADGTPSGSRNGHPVLAFAMLYRIIGRDGFKHMAKECLEKAEYLTGKLRMEGVDVFHNEGALTVFVPRPSDYIVNKYTLACSDGGAHVITMQHVTYELLDRFIADYIEWHWDQACSE